METLNTNIFVDSPTVDNLKKYLDSTKKMNELQEKINKSIEFIENHNKKTGNLYYKYNNKYLLSEIKEDLLKILKGEE